MDKSKKLDKKGVKGLVKNKGFFCSLSVGTEKNAPAQFSDKVPEGATYFEGIASDGEMNRNGYIIREKAWKNAIDDFFKNPIILLQHNLDEPIGNALWAKVGKNGLAVGGYLFDEMTGGRLAKGLLKALSTGHITKAVEFENQKTGEVITEEEYRAKRDSGEIGWGDQNWVLAVTELEWVEFSLVSIGSNRASFITKHDAIETYLKNGAITENGIAEILAKNECEEDKEVAENDEAQKAVDAGEAEIPEEAKVEAKEEKAEGEKVKISEEEKAKLDAAAKLARETLEALEKAQSETEVEEKKGEDEEADEKKEKDESEAEKADEEEKSEKADEKPAEPEAENAEKPEEKTEKVEAESEKKEPEDAGKDGGTAENKFDVTVEVKTAINSIVAENNSLRLERDELKAKVAKFEAAPDKKGLIYSSQFGGGENNAKKPEAEKSDGGKSAIDFLRSNGIEVE